ncbi:hypothetical protein VTJ04DRAFT_2548 [Mycothermus thermophilus]|uniref:uncharacterized protein n=1 Tax=Humicola insolens TaxID=85995 RepID=UPI00374233ED
MNEIIHGTALLPASTVMGFSSDWPGPLLPKAGCRLGYLSASVPSTNSEPRQNISLRKSGPRLHDSLPLSLQSSSHPTTT